jgi:hypothetical protein
VKIEPEITGGSIVLVGSFNPAIFSPDWFIRHGLIRESEVIRDDGKLLIFHQIAQFSLEWCQISVEPNRFVIGSTRDPLVKICDLAVRTFGEFLPHAPLHQLGINREVHFKVESLDVRDRMGFKLAPPSSWGDWGKDLAAKSGRRRGGLKTLTMQQQVFSEPRTGYIQATVQPSAVITDGAGVFVQVNDHYDASKPGAGNPELVELLENQFEASLSHSHWIVDQIMKSAHD